ncbi:glycosyltransferase family 2 protein [Burkholderia vietnamiensis]|uniref:glycosyltransferase family 2 protein n=1 Tax=Burkholderia vietnamiensis TaxID=60552 RepID=UPI001594D9D1|nr:glycosyltransferase family 2 protein [Burkholderia vietnamiensis]MCA8068892.1 glycosyltransferase family 2 protein [Burkholderia vietnamiensis]UEC04712.1 glycosyltransferase family 2 protein [Burkholderia vietnamiensis]HDR8988592.1 glycosyltransferase family 2 protein [Burkholderia vietnamiensis]
MNVLILAAGAATMEPVDGEYPLLLAEIDGVTLIERVIQSVGSLVGDRLIVALRRSEMTRFHMGDVVTILRPDAALVPVADSVRGAACTALLASEYIDSDSELLIVNANQLVDVNLAEIVHDFRSGKLDAGLITFQSVHPRYSYVRVGEDGLVTEAAEKRPISRFASAGVYWFASGRSFLAGVRDMIRKDVHVGGDFYVTPVLNELILNQARIGLHNIESSRYLPIKSERQLQHTEAHYEQGV